MSGEGDARAQVGVSRGAQFTGATGQRGIDRDDAGGMWSIESDSSELMTGDDRAIHDRIADAAFGEPVQVGPSQAHRADFH